MANEKVQRYDPYYKDDFGHKVEARLWPDTAGDVVLYSDHAAREQELLKALREYRHPDPDADPIIFHDECFKDDTRNVDTRCDLCKRVDRLLKEGE